MEKTFIFDYDDTLVPNEYTYSLAQLEFTKWVVNKLGMKAPDVPSMMNLHIKIDKEAVKTMGFSMERFPTSFRETYKSICELKGIKTSEDELNHAYELGMSAFDESLWREKGLVEGAAETLDFLLQKRDKLLLLTKGDRKVQEKKIEVTGINKWFGGDIYIVPQKNEEIILRYCDGKDKSKIWHVGNSIRSDVEPALKAGIKMIYIPCETWAYEMEHNGVQENPNLLILRNIIEIKEKYDIIK